MRFAFLDEGGISQHEPWVVVAGVVVHGDQQLIPLERELERLVKKHIPKEQQPGFVFHAKEIWSGTGKVFGDRDRWSLDNRLRILRDLARIPRKLDIPIVHETVERREFLAEIKLAPGQKPPTAHELSVSAHAVAFSSCTMRIEQYMREYFKDEVAQVVAEDNDQARKMLKGVHEILRYPERADGGLWQNNFLPFQRIRGSLHFADKNESGPLQLADLCAFVIRGHLCGRDRYLRLYNRLKGMMFKFARAGESYSGLKVSVRPPYEVIDYEQSYQEPAQIFYRPYPDPEPEQPQ